jgi:hypothetical protein
LENTTMVTLMLLFAPAVVLIAILIMNAFQKRNALSKLHIERARVARGVASPQARRQRVPPEARTEAARKTAAKKHPFDELTEILRVPADR